MKKHLVLLSGGVGTRFEEKIPKQYYIDSYGELIITKSITPFLRRGFDSLVVVCDESYIELITREFREKIDPNTKLIFTKNGKERQDSIDNGIAAIQKHFKINPNDQLFIQEAVRPFVSDEMVTELLEASDEWLSISPAIHPAVLFGTMEKNVVKEVIPKTDIIELQVPKRHNLQYLINHRDVLDKDHSKILDESQVFTLTGKKIHLTEGSVRNVKITFPSHKKLFN